MLPYPRSIALSPEDEQLNIWPLGPLLRRIEAESEHRDPPKQLPIAAQSFDPRPVAKKANLDLPYGPGVVNGDKSDEEAPEIVTFYGRMHESNATIFCMDRSGSMNTLAKLPVVKREVVKTISEFSLSMQFAVVFFDTETSSFPARGQAPVWAAWGEKGKANAFVWQQRAGVYTCMKEALERSLGFADKCKKSPATIFLLSDGMAECPGAEEDRTRYKKEIMDMLNRKNKKRHVIIPMLVGDNADLPFARQIAESHGNGSVVILGR